MRLPWQVYRLAGACPVHDPGKAYLDPIHQTNQCSALAGRHACEQGAPGAQEAQLACMTILRMAEEDRRSYSAIDRSLPADASKSASAGLNLTAVTVSEPQDSSLMGSERSWSQMSTCEAQELQTLLMNSFVIGHLLDELLSFFSQWCWKRRQGR